ncbi:MAG TPA: lactate utilization protein LutB domain-containing protein, partial [Nocardioides sp.]|nr:lactate utilization protein LutB domain-containing protein [Nocardioides sp.]
KGTGDPQTDSLPYASSLCGACFEACPVRIDIPEVLVHLRAKVVDAHRGDRVPKPEAAVFRGAGWAFGSSRRLQRAERLSGIAGRVLRRRGRTSIGRLPGAGASWTDARDLPVPPAESFRDWWKRTGGGR